MGLHRIPKTHSIWVRIVLTSRDLNAPQRGVDVTHQTFTVSSQPTSNHPIRFNPVVDFGLLTPSRFELSDFTNLSNLKYE
jgi:hypothetical protein